jgi:uncharacterized membrane protein YcaP (DUF421 family)
MLSPAFASIMSADLFTVGVPIAEKVLRSVIVYAFLIALLRIAGKRTAGSLSSFDLVVLLLLSNTVQNAIIGNDDSLLGGLIGAVVLVALNYGVVWFLYKHRTVDHAVEGSPSILIRHGKYVDANLSRQLVTRAEVQAAARRQGIQHMADIETARLEIGGSVTFELAEQTTVEAHNQDIVARLERIEAALTRLNGLNTAPPAPST